MFMKRRNQLLLLLLLPRFLSISLLYPFAMLLKMVQSRLHLCWRSHGLLGPSVALSVSPLSAYDTLEVSIPAPEGFAAPESRGQRQRRDFRYFSATVSASSTQGGNVEIPKAHVDIQTWLREYTLTADALSWLHFDARIFSNS